MNSDILKQNKHIMNSDILKQQGNQAGKFMPEVFDILKAGQPKVFNIELGDDDSTAFLMGEDVTIAAKGLDTTYDKLVIKLFDESTYTLVKALSYDASAVFSVSLMSGENMGLVNGYVTQDSVNLKAMTASGSDSTPILYIDPVYADANKETVEALGEFTVLPVFLMTSPDSSDKSLALLSKEAVSTGLGEANLARLQVSDTISWAYCNFSNGLVSPVSSSAGTLMTLEAIECSIKRATVFGYGLLGKASGWEIYSIPSGWDTDDFSQAAFIKDPYDGQLFIKMDDYAAPNLVNTQQGEKAVTFCGISRSNYGSNSSVNPAALRYFSIVQNASRNPVVIDGRTYENFIAIKNISLSSTIRLYDIQGHLSTVLSQNGYTIRGISSTELNTLLPDRKVALDVEACIVRYSGTTDAPSELVGGAKIPSTLFTGLFQKYNRDEVDSKLYMCKLYFVDNSITIGSTTYPGFLAYKDFATNITLTEIE